MKSTMWIQFQFICLLFFVFDLLFMLFFSTFSSISSLSSGCPSIYAVHSKNQITFYIVSNRHGVVKQKLVLITVFQFELTINVIFTVEICWLLSHVWWTAQYVLIFIYIFSKFSIIHFRKNGTLCFRDYFRRKKSTK